MKRLLLFGLIAIMGLGVNAQLLTWTPPFPTEDDPSQTLEITVDATRGNKGLMDYASTGDVYVHIGVITNLSTAPNDWKYVKFEQNFNQPNAQLQATYAGDNLWQFTITGSLKTYFGVPANETIKKIAILFRNGNGSRKQANADNSDMYIPVSDGGFAVRIFEPPIQPTYTPIPETVNWKLGDFATVAAESSKPCTINLYNNGALIGTSDDVDILGSDFVITYEGNYQLVAQATDGTNSVYDTLNIFVSPASSPVAALPAGMEDGINYEPGDTSVTLVLRAPGKNKATVIGDFNNWIQDTGAIMKKTPDGKFFWLRVHPLTPGTEYAYQYLVDDSIRIADPYAEKILDPGNDQYISSSTYPNLKPYPAGQTGIVGVLQTAQAAYQWSVTDFDRPAKEGLVIYELLVRDFVAAHDWKTVTDSLDYLKTLGINAIEVMPFNEFEGNISWGYNPDFYFAPDKYYGTETSLKTFIDSCHSKGIAVIMDMVLNHTYGPSPLKLLYYNSSTGQPASNNPWYNQVAPHAFGFGDDFNHASADTKYFFDRVLQHWITDYKIDGYRFDFSKGLTQKPSSNDATFSAYDASRIANILGYYNAIRAVDSSAYLILEHFCDNTEEKELADSGLLVWGNLNDSYAQASMGWPDRWDFSRGIYTARNWTSPHLVTYMESHDEERIVYKDLAYGNSVPGGYSTKDTATALRRMELDAAFLLTIPGPKMIWQFGELGYSYSINTCENGTVSNDCRLSPKPIRWDYLDDPRRKNVYDTYSSLARLRFHPWYRDAFISGTINQNLSGATKWITVSSGDTSHLLVVGNFDITAHTATVTFPTAGTWYDYLNNVTYAATGNAQDITLNPGEFHVYVSRNVNNVTATPVTNIPWNENELNAKLYPNPVASGLTIEMNLPQTGVTRVDLYTILGQYLTTLYEGVLVKGKHQLPIKRNAVAHGSYYIKISAKSGTKTIPVTFQ